MMEFRKMRVQRCEAHAGLPRDQYNAPVALADRRYVRLDTTAPMHFDAVRPGCDSIMSSTCVPGSQHVATLKRAPLPNTRSDSVSAHNPAGSDYLPTHNDTRLAQSSHRSLPEQPGTQFASALDQFFVKDKSTQPQPQASGKI